MGLNYKKKKKHHTYSDEKNHKIEEENKIIKEEYFELLDRRASEVREKYKPIGFSKSIGKPRIVRTKEQLALLLNDFIPFCKAYDYIPDIEGLACFLGCDRKTIHEYETNEKYGYSHLIRNIKEEIAFYKKQLAFNNKINPILYIFDAKNNHGYTDVKQVNTQNDHNFNLTFNIPRPEIAAAAGSTGSAGVAAANTTILIDNDDDDNT